MNHDDNYTNEEAKADIYDNYINEPAKAKGIDPRRKLKDFVLDYKDYIRPEKKQEITYTYRLRAVSAEDQLEEFVESQNPYKVLEKCFTHGRLHRLAEDEFNIDPDSGLRNSELISEMLYKLGFKNQVKPITGLSQIQNDISPSLETAQNTFQLSSTDVRGICGHMADIIEDIMQVLFLFHIGALQNELDGRQLDELTEIELETKTDEESEPEKRDNPEDLWNRYKKKKKKNIYMGDLVLFLKDLMDILRKYYELREYCQNNYGCDVPLTQDQLGQLGIFTVYRNIITHTRKNLNWKRNKRTAKTNLSIMEKDSDTHTRWQKSWDAIVDAYDSNQDFPKREMIQTMAAFVRELLDSLSKGIYPKVIVIRSYKVDEYGTVTIHADSSDPNDREGVTFTLCNLPKFDFNSYTFTECYYHSHTNLAGIEPILVKKEELEKVEDWAIRSNNETDKQKEK